MASSSNLLGKRNPEDDLENKPILKKHKETSEDKETTDSLQHKSDQEAAVTKKTLFVGHLPPKSKISDIIDFFKDVAQVVSVRLFVTRKCVHRCYGRVQFASVNEAKKALEKKNGEYLHDHKIFLKVDKNAPYPPRPRICIDHNVWNKDYLRRESLPIEEDETSPDFVEEVLFVANISPQTKILHIKEFFKDVGEVVSVRLIVNPQGKHVGYGFVDFASSNEAKKALETKNGEYLHGHKIFLEVAKRAPNPPRPKYNLAEKLCYEDSLRRQNLLVEEDKGPNFVEAVAGREKMLFVSRLSCEAEISHIISFFKDVGQVVSVRLIVDYTGEHVGDGFVEFASANEAEKALEKKNGEYLQNYQIFLNVATKAPYPQRPKFCIDHNVWNKDYLRREGLPIEEDETPPDFVEEVLFVANLSPQTKISHIKEFFKDVGEVVRVRLIVNHEGKHVGYGFVDFASANEAKMALETKNGEYLHDHKIFLEVAKSAPDPPRPKYNLAEKLCYEDSLRRQNLVVEEDETVEGLDETPNIVEAVAVREKTLFVSRLSCEAEISHILNFFKDVGQVVSVRLIVDYTGKHVGDGFVEFASANEAEEALEKKNGECLHDHKIFLDVAKKAPYPQRAKYCIDHKVWYEDFLRREGLLIDEDEAVEDVILDLIEEVAARRKTLFVANIPYETKIPDIVDFLQDVGEVVSFRLIVDHRGEHVGCGFAEFGSVYEAEEVLEKKNGKSVHQMWSCSEIFLDVVEIAPYPLRPKYKLAENLWSKVGSLMLEEEYYDNLKTKKPKLKKKKVPTMGISCGKKIIFPDENP